MSAPEAAHFNLLDLSIRLGVATVCSSRAGDRHRVPGPASNAVPRRRPLPLLLATGQLSSGAIRMSKRDLKRELRHLYHAPAKRVVEVDVPTFPYLMIDGEGDPNTAPAYAQAVEALFSVSYTAKFALKKSAAAVDYGVMPLEGLWWAEDWSVFSRNDRARWKWTMMILQPDFLPGELIAEAIERVGKKKDLPALEKMRLERFHEGPCAQILHVGPFTEEGPTIARLHEYVDARAGRGGKHHEIYLSDVRRAAPSRWKTIIRQPMGGTAEGAAP